MWLGNLEIGLHTSLGSICLRGEANTGVEIAGFLDEIELFLWDFGDPKSPSWSWLSDFAIERAAFFIETRKMQL